MRKFALYLSALSMALAPSVILEASPASAATPFQNGSFEDNSSAYAATGCYSSGHCYEAIAPSYPNASVMPGWTVTAGSVDWINGWWTSQDGNYSIDMNGSANGSVVAPGAIAQTFSTVAGATYNVGFYLAANYNGGTPMTMTLYVQATGNAQGTYSFTPTTSDSYSNMGWTSESYTFVASSSTTTLSFTADPTNLTNAGPALDNVTISEPFATTGAGCKNGGWASLFNPTTSDPFRNQGECVSYFATLGDVPIGS